MTVGAILESSAEKAVLEILYAEIRRIYTRQVDDKEFIIYLAVNNVLSYAKTDSQGRFTRTDGSPIAGVDDPLDSRLVYPNLRQVMLALRMIKRGDSIPAGTRLEFVFVRRPKAVHEGDRLEDYDFYRENRIYFILRQAQRLSQSYRIVANLFGMSVGIVVLSINSSG